MKSTVHAILGLTLFFGVANSYGQQEAICGSENGQGLSKASSTFFIQSISPSQSDVYALCIYVSFPDEDVVTQTLPSYWQSIQNTIGDYFEKMSYNTQHVHLSTAIRPSPNSSKCYMADNNSTYYHRISSNDYTGIALLNTEILNKVYNDNSSAFNNVEMVFINLNISTVDIIGNASGLSTLGPHTSTHYTGAGTTQEFWNEEVLKWSIAHEYGHQLGLGHPVWNDFRKYTGIYDLMYNHMLRNKLGQGGPNPISIDNLIKLNWITSSRIINVNSDIYNNDIKDIRIDGNVYRLDINSNEYFLVENHQKSNYDQIYDGSGLLIWHIKAGGIRDIESALGKWVVGTNVEDPISGKDSLDYHEDLYHGSAMDFFNPSTKINFSQLSNPSSNGYNGFSSSDPENIYSHLAILNIRQSLSDPKALRVDFIKNFWSGQITQNTITQNTTWAGQIYINGTVSVQNGATLTICPGTVVNFMGYYSIAVYSNSKIIAEGTQTSPIMFKSAIGTNPKSWDSFYVNGSNNSFKYCTFQSGDWALCLPTSSTGNVIQNCTFLNNDQAIRIYSNTATISNCDIHRNRHALVCYNNTNLTLQSNKIHFNGRDGVYSMGGNVIKLYWNVIDTNGTNTAESTRNGLYAVGSDNFWLGYITPPTEGNNTIRLNYDCGIKTNSTSSMIRGGCGQNAVFSDGGYELWNYIGNILIQMPNTWWGSNPPNQNEFYGTKEISYYLQSCPSWVGKTSLLGKALDGPLDLVVKERNKKLKEIIKSKISSPEAQESLKELYSNIRSDYTENQFGERDNMYAFLEDINKNNKDIRIGKIALCMMIDWETATGNHANAIQLSKEAIQVLFGEERMGVLGNLTMLYFNTDQIENAKVCLAEYKNKYSNDQAYIQSLEEEMASVCKQIAIGVRSLNNQKEMPKQGSESGSVDQLDLLQNYPNPGNPSTTIRFSLPEKTTLSVKIVNILGEVVCILADRTFEEGVHEVIWDGKNEQGVSVSSGIYLYVLQTPNKVVSKKLSLLK